MRTSIGQNASMDAPLAKTVYRSRFKKAENLNALKAAEAALLDLIYFQGIDVFINSLKMMHDFALYHTDLSIDTEEKKALFNLKILWEALEDIEKE